MTGGNFYVINHAGNFSDPDNFVLKKRCSENMQQIYSRTPMPNCNFNKVPLHFFRTPFPKTRMDCRLCASTTKIGLL